MQCLCTATACVLDLLQLSPGDWLIPRVRKEQTAFQQVQGRAAEERQVVSNGFQNPSFCGYQQQLQLPKDRSVYVCHRSWRAEQPATALQHSTSRPSRGPGRKDHAAGEKGPP